MLLSIRDSDSDSLLIPADEVPPVVSSYRTQAYLSVIVTAVIIYDSSASYIRYLSPLSLLNP